MTDPWLAFSSRLFDQNLFAIKLGLDNIREALRLEGSPEKRVPAIVVGGTNGKGTTAAYISNILEAHGLKVGLYTSPHLIEVRERFRINGRPASRDLVLRVGSEVLSTYAQPDSQPCLTFFELTTLMAAKIFAGQNVDVAVYEVGLGGRLDAVNAIEPAITVFTTIDLDHQTYLGNTIQEIASEKADLARPDRPVVIGLQDYPEALEVLKNQAPHASVAGQDFPASDDAHRYHVRHQSTALEAARIFLKDAFNPNTAEQAIERTHWAGRMDRILDGKIRGPWLIDGAHNVGGTTQLFQATKPSEIGACVFSAVADKDLEAMLLPLQAPEWQDIPLYFAQMATKRGSDVGRIQTIIPRLMFEGDVEATLPAARLTAGEKTVLVFGSLYLVGEAFDVLGITSDDLSTWIRP